MGKTWNAKVIVVGVLVASILGCTAGLKQVNYPAKGTITMAPWNEGMKTKPVKSVLYKKFSWGPATDQSTMESTLVEAINASEGDAITNLRVDVVPAEFFLTIFGFVYVQVTGEVSRAK